MPMPVDKGLFRICQKSGRIVGFSSRFRALNWLFPLFGAVATIWWLVRVLPKPSRAAYPCQRVAGSVAATFISYLVAFPVAVLAFKKARRFLWESRYVLAALCLLAGLVSASVSLVNSSAPAMAWVPSDSPNAPVGIAKGIFPGRVAWLRDTNATPWNGSTGYWWYEGTGINTQAEARMISRCLRGVSGAGSDAEAWDKLFRFYNSTHGRGDVGYQTNEAIAIKVNLNNTYGGYTDADGDIDTSPSSIRSMLVQLTAKAGVPQAKITVYDSSPNGNNRAIPDRIYTPLHAEFPGVHWVDCRGLNGREAPAWVSGAITYSSSIAACGTNLPACVVNATYLINMALLKGHEFSGVTLCGKNHFGTIQYPNNDHGKYVSAYKQPMGSYNAYVDLMGSTNLGAKTVLYVIDGLYGMRTNVKDPNATTAAWSNLFAGAWSSSYFMSQDPVAIDSVGLDFLAAEWKDRLGYSASYQYGSVTNCDNYLIEAALATNSAFGSYHPNGVPISSLGVHEHWNDPTNKLYSRNLGATNGIELLQLHLTAAMTVSITSPTTGTVLDAGTNIVITTSTTTNYASISTVDFYRNGSLLGTATNSPFSFAWTNVPYGNWSLTAVATDADGFTATSAVVNITAVLNGISIALTNPPTGSVFSEGTNITLVANALATNGINHVDFYSGASLLGTTNAAPYQLVLTNVPAGAWPLTAVLADNSGIVITSSVVNITVLRNISVAITSPTNGMTFVEGTDFSLMATAGCPFSVISKIDFYSNGGRIGTASNSPFTIVWKGVGAGSQLLTAIATDNGGFTATSAVVSVTGKIANIAVAGTLYVDLRALDTRGGTTFWTNRGALAGVFTNVGAPVFVTNSAGTGIPAVQFNGTTDAFAGPNSVGDIDGASDRTIEGWVYNPVIANEETVLEIGHRNTGGRNCAFNYGTNLTWGACAQADAAHDVGWVQSTNIPPAGAWHHFVYTYSGSTTCLFYVDGTLRVTKNMTALNIFAGEPILLGAQRGSAANLPPSLYWYSGFLNSIRVHGGCLSADAVASNYAAGPFIGTGPATLTASPISRTVFEHDNVSFAAAASGTGPLGWQWLRNGAPVSGATNSSLALTNVLFTDNNANFAAVVSNNFNGAACVATSSVGALTVITPGSRLTHRYSFASNANDSIGIAHGALSGAAAITNGQLVLNGTANTYADIPGGQIAVRNYSAVTFEAWATFGTNANWPRLFDQGSKNGNNGQYDLYFCPRSGSGDYRLTIMDPNPTERRVTVAGNLDNKTNIHIVCVLDPQTGFMGIYTNGSLAASSNTLTSLASVDSNYFYLGRSLFAADAWLNGSIDEFRIYNVALSPNVILSNYNSDVDVALPLGPAQITNNPAPAGILEYETATLSVGTYGDGPFSYQWFCNSNSIAGATNATYSFAGAQLGDNGSQFFCIISNTYNATPWSVTSAVATVTVAVNTNLPTPLAVANSNGAVTITYHTTPGRTYSVERSDSLLPPAWTNIVPGQTATNITQTITDISTGAVQRFYRPLLSQP